MRAKEYIACSEDSLKHPAEIRQIIDEMLPLRSSRQQTVDYYNRKLIADIRLQACLLQKELYEKNNAVQTAEPEEFQMKEGEIPVEIAASVRDELFDVIKEDKTFGNLYFLLGNLRNSQRPTNPIDCVPDEHGIVEALKISRDDYPKSSLSEFLDDNSYENQAAKDLMGRFICEIISRTAQDDKRLGRIEEELDRHLPNESSLPDMGSSKFHLQQKKGRKTDFVRVMNVLLEMGFIVDSDAAKAKKSDFFQALGKLLNENFKDYQNLLSTTKGASVSESDQRALTKVFEDMLAKQKDIISK